MRACTPLPARAPTHPSLPFPPAHAHSINYLHCGRPKSWYSIPPHAARRFESMAQGLDPDGFRLCAEHLRHKTSMFSPKVQGVINR